MSAALLPYIPRVQTNAAWLEEPWVFFVPPYDVPDTPNTPEDFTGLTITLGLYDRASGTAILQASTTNGYIALVGTNEINLTVPKAATAGLLPYAGTPDAPAICDFDLIVSGNDEPLLYGTVHLVQGIAQQ